MRVHTGQLLRDAYSELRQPQLVELWPDRPHKLLKYVDLSVLSGRDIEILEQCAGQLVPQSAKRVRSARFRTHA